MSNHLQPYYEIRINDVDVTPSVLGDVSYEERGDLLTTLEFRLSRGSYFAEVLKVGAKITLYGGTLDEKNQKLFFKGNIKRLLSEWPDSGLSTFKIIAYSGTWGATARSTEVHVYPGKNSERTWARVSSLKASEIVQNLASELGMTAEIDIVADVSYTYSKPIKQNYITDWAFLIDMAKKINCVVWPERVGDVETLYFIDKDKCRDKTSAVEFVYPERDEQTNFLIPMLQPNQNLVRNLSIDEDSDAAEGNIRKITSFDSATGEAKIQIQEYDADKDELFTWELDENKVRNAPQEVQDSLWDMGAFNIPFEIAKKFYKKVDIAGKNSKGYGVQGRPYVGIKATCTVDGNVLIRANQSYNVFGVGKYSTKSGRTTWFAVSVKHQWTSAGYETELEFMR